MTKMLLPGDAAPWFQANALSGNPSYSFDTAAGRPIVLLFLGSGAWPPGADALALVARNRNLFDDRNACFFGVSVDPADVSEDRIAQQLPGIRWFLDHDARVARLYGAVEETGKGHQYQPHWLLLDPMLRVVLRAPIAEGQRVLDELQRLVTAHDTTSFAPVLTLPRIFDDDLCRRLIDLYDRTGGNDSGFMRDVNGVTVGIVDHGQKKRSDMDIEDEALKAQIRSRMSRFLLPQVERSFQFKVTRMERYIVACYDGDQGGGYFRAHRDNTTAGTAHRRFACTINLNADQYEGGDLRFPEFGPRTYRAETGGAVVFSCSLLHEAMPVTKGRRLAFLPFFYDDAAARLREANTKHVSGELAEYRADRTSNAAVSSPTSGE